MTRETNKAGIELIKRFEGLRLTSYRDAVGVLTIGYGHTGRVGDLKIRSGLRISEAQAEQLLREDLERFEAAVEKAAKVELTSDQFPALVSFAFNLGGCALRRSTLLKRLNKGKYRAASKQFGRWVKAGGRTLRGLVIRREAERKLFLSKQT